jgi:hypothetical protein
MSITDGIVTAKYANDINIGPPKPVSSWSRMITKPVKKIIKILKNMM